MASAKDIHLAPISRRDADALIRRLHYSGTVTNNTLLHLGVFLGGQLEGALQFGPSMDKSKLVNVVRGTAWHSFIELSRMAFSDRLPRNSESRALGIAMRLMRKQYPQLQWVVSFADATACGDGTIYRAAGFALTGITKNLTIMVTPWGERVTNLSITANWDTPRVAAIARRLGMLEFKYRARQAWIDAGCRYVPGYQLRYIYFLDPSARARLAVPELDYSEIARRGAGMYLGVAREAGDDRAPPETAMAQHQSPRSIR